MMNTTEEKGYSTAELRSYLNELVFERLEDKSIAVVRGYIVVRQA